MLGHLSDPAYRMLGRDQIVQAPRCHFHLPPLGGAQPNRRRAARRGSRAGRLPRGFALPRQQLVHLQLCIIYITNIIHKKIISSINELASENFAWSVKHLWKSLKKSQALSEAKDLQFRSGAK
jgi:hypothetical protein